MKVDVTIFVLGFGFRMTIVSKILYMFTPKLTIGRQVVIIRLLDAFKAIIKMLMI